MATYVIGDVQGCYDPLMRLLDKIQFNEQSDRLWFAGDLINRGPDSLKVLRFVSQLPAHHQTVLGNHDLYFLSVVLAGVALKKSDTLGALYQARDLELLIQWLRRQPFALYDPTFNTLVVHAGVAQTWTLATTLDLAHEAAQQLQSAAGPSLLMQMTEDQPKRWQTDLSGIDRWRCITNYLTRVRIISAQDELDLSFKNGLDAIPTGFMPWYQVPNRQSQTTHIVFGHWAALQGDVPPQYNVAAVDTGCAWGKHLTAYRLEDSSRISASALLKNS